MTTATNDYHQMVNVGLWLRAGLTVEDCVEELLDQDWHQDDAYDLVEEVDEILEDESDRKFLRSVKKLFRVAEKVADQLDDGSDSDACLDDLIERGFAEHDAEDILVAAEMLADDDD